MSSQDQNNGEDGIKSTKRPKNLRACDTCRLKKCDGQQGPGQKCWRCSTYDVECTFVRDPPKRQAKPKPRGYAQHLEARIVAMEGLFSRLCPTSNLSRELSAMYDDESDFGNSGMSGSSTEDEDQANVFELPRRERTEDEDQFTYAVPPAFAPSTPNDFTESGRIGFPISGSDPDSQLIKPDDQHLSTLAAGSSFSTTPIDELEPSDDETNDALALEGHSLYRRASASRRFFGKSSNVAIVKKAAEMKSAYAKNFQAFGAPLSAEDLWRKTLGPIEFPFCVLHVPMYMRGAPGMYVVIRIASCISHIPCEQWIHGDLYAPVPLLSFPEPDLLYALIGSYFEHFNVYLPVLHRPLFLAAVADGLHTRNVDFGSVVLIVCALGARFSDDGRVLLERKDADAEERSKVEANGDAWGWYSAGWKWFEQVDVCSRALTAPASLYDLQITCLAALYFLGLSAPEVSRRVMGLGLRLAQDFGAHRKKTYNDLPREEAEMLKRTFWCLLWLDWMQSPNFGRPCAVQYEDIDSDYPVVCDDEYWITLDPASAFQQPPGKPSVMAYFECLLRLNQIHAFAHRTLYSTDKSKNLLGFMGPQWEQRIVIDLDSALNSWLDSVPPYLRWDPHNPDPVFLHQSACLTAFYHALQITIHRPFIPHPRKPSRTPFPSLAICTSAARSCVRVLDIVHKRTGATDILHFCTLPLFMSGIVLMLNMWGSGSPITQRTVKDMEDVHQVMSMLKEMEPRFHLAGRTWDCLYELAVVGELPLPPFAAPQTVKPQARVPAAVVVGGPSSVARKSAETALPNETKRRRRGSAGMIYPVMVHPAPSPASSGKLGWLPSHLLHSDAPAASHTDYDMSPSVFNPPSATSSVIGPESINPDSGLDSIFTTPRPHRTSPLPYLNASSSIPPQPPLSAPSYSVPTTHARPQPRSSFDFAGTSSSLFSYPTSNETQPAMLESNNDSLAMWSNAPAGFEWDDWDTYINELPARTVPNSAFSQPTQGGLPPDNTARKVFTFYDTPF